MRFAREESVAPHTYRRHARVQALSRRDAGRVPLQDLWADIQPIGSGTAERLGYPTQKPEALLERILRARPATRAT